MPRDYSKTEVLDIIEKEARERGIPRDDFLRFAYIETGGKFDETASRGPNGAKGLFQFVPDTAKAYGIAGRELDPVANTDAAAQLYLDNRKSLVARHDKDGRPYLSGSAQPDGLDMYLAHQQGAAGYRSIQTAIATGEFGRDDTRRNILNNISAKDFEKVTGHKFADVSKMSDRDLATSFTTYWDKKFDRIQIPEKNIGPATQTNTPAQTTPAQTTPTQASPAQTTPAQTPAQNGKGIELNDAHALTLKYDHVKYAINDPKSKSYIPGVDGKHPDQGYVDCSGWAATVQNANMREINREAGREVFSKSDMFNLGNDSAARIVQKSEERSGVMLTGAQVTRGALKEGMIIGEDNGPTSFDKGRYKGIDHIVTVVRDPKSGELMVSQSRGGEGVELSSLDKYLERKQANGTKLYATDPLSQARTLLQEREQTQAQDTRTTPRTTDALADGMLKRGEDGAAVKQLQTQLSELGFKRQDGKPFNATGHYGENTVAAVTEFQKANGLPPTGEADKATREKIETQLQQRTATQAAPADAAPSKLAPTQSNVAQPSLSSPQHPDHGLYKQALSNLEQLGPSGGFMSREQMEQAAGALAADAKASGLGRIDHVSRSNNGQGFLIAVQGVNGDPSHPAAKHAYIDYTQATTQTLEQSTRMADAKATETPQVAQQAQDVQRRGP